MKTFWDITWQYWGAGGILLLPIALISVFIWGLFLRSTSLIGAVIQDGHTLENELHTDILGKRAIRCLYQDISHIPGSMAMMLKTSLYDALQGAHPRDAILTREEECLEMLQRDIVILTALTTVAPLLGLLGTVIGMIDTFTAVSTIGGNTEMRVADGISQALITTQFGLIVALPGVFGVARLKRMIGNAQVVMTDCRWHTLRILENGNCESL